jgi:carboxyl-terminal processing protease
VAKRRSRLGKLGCVAAACGCAWLLARNSTMTQTTPLLLACASLRLAVSALALAALASCGGGGGSSSSSSSSSGLPPSSSLAEQCAVPRTGTDPVTGVPYPDTLGSFSTEKAWLRSWIDESYLWYQDVRALPAATLDPSGYTTDLAYFNALKTPLLDAAGKPKDKFHFTYDTITWEQLSQQGVQYGYGFEVALLQASPPRSAIVAYLDAPSGTPANANNIARGAAIITVDGVDMATGSDVATLNAGLFPTAAGTHTLVIRDEGATTTRSVTMTAQAITETPVQNVMVLPAPYQQVGYLLFNDHIATAESELVAAFTQFRNAGITDLVLDIRYNGGGYLDIASEVAYMIAGPSLTTQATPLPFFERESYNDRNPFNLSLAQTTTLFHDQGEGFTVSTNQALPFLGLSRVFVLTSADTCSASEAIVNGLRGVGVTVNLIGGTTCGKPYGFFPQDNCGTTYFAIQFQGVNNMNFGNYPDGFAPTCSVADDFTHALGNPVEAQLDMALGLRANGTCSPAMGASAHVLSATAGRAAPSATPVLVRNPFRENRILRLN